MSGFAVRDDGVFGYRAVESADDLMPHEFFSETAPLRVEAQQEPPETKEQILARAQTLIDQAQALVASIL